MIATVLLALALSLLVAGPAGAARLEVHTDVTRATISAQSGVLAVSSEPPMAVDLPAGRYRLSISTGRTTLGAHDLDVERGIRLRGSDISRAVSSAILPGSGQWRDDSWWSGAITAGSVGLMLGRALYFNAKAGSRREEIDGSSATDAVLRARLDAEVHEASRDDYLFLAGGFYFVNVVDAFARRGAIRFAETGPGVVTARYRPAGVLESALWSAVAPGAGQLRQGRVGRARVWNILGVGVGYFWAQAQRQVEKARARVRFHQSTSSTAETGYLQELASLESAVDEQEALARTAAYVAAGVWAYNIADAAFLAARGSADSGEMVRNDEDGSGWSLSPGWVGGAAGVVLDVNF